jgi:oxygen-independent coproporphyrinogen-3 oxidase
MQELSVYVHIPFCAKKCSYCDFNAYSGMGALAYSFVNALLKEIAGSELKGRPVSTIFFGGGTPTYLAAEQLTAILAAIGSQYNILPDAEISAEANPTSAEADKFEAMRSAGFNRLSIGVQAFQDRLLRAVDREHSAEEAVEAFQKARSAGFENISIDLMFGLPEQTREDWEESLERAIELGTEHLSVYSLTIEPGTRFERLHAGGKLALPDEDSELWMYERAIERLYEAGLEHYEVSNFARRGYQARHNLTYWHNREYIGFGPGAVSYIEGRRWTNEKLPSRYIAKIRDGKSLTTEEEQLSTEGALAETLMVGLRLREGIALSPLKTRYGVDPRQKYQALFERLSEEGLLEETEDTIRLNHKGLLRANDIFIELLPE